MRPPTQHELRAALRVARIIDAGGNSLVDVHGSYLHLPTQGEHRSADLQVGEGLLRAAGVLVQSGDRLAPSRRLEVLARVDDATALAVLTDLLAAATGILPWEDDFDRREIMGAAGEEAVADACRHELEMLGWPAMAAGVQRVSLLDNRLGYDVSAPCLNAGPRKLEVKTSTGADRGSMRFFLSRNEYEVGRRNPEQWALVACAIGAAGVDSVDIVGWCRAITIQPYLPDDCGGRWTEALVRLPVSQLRGGVPSAA